LNYRHAFHAGNFSDVVKHAVLVRLLLALLRKDKPFVVIDSHAGRGLYDLTGEEAQRGGEWPRGIGRMAGTAHPLLEDYLSLVHSAGEGRYPGSPWIARALLRPDDRLIACELHPEEFAALRRTLGADRRVSLHARDAWEALGALLPPTPRRGLVLVDPAFEAPDEFARMEQAVGRAVRRWPTGIYALWYPEKNAAAIAQLHAAAAAWPVAEALALSLPVGARPEPDRFGRRALHATGLLLLNPPYGFAEEAPMLLDRLQTRLAEPDAAPWRIEVLRRS